MRPVVFGLAVGSPPGDDRATLGRSLIGAMVCCGARHLARMYGDVDSAACRLGGSGRGPLSSLGAYATGRRAAPGLLFIDTAWQRPGPSRLLAGAGYPPDLPRTDNILLVGQLPRAAHPAVFASASLTLSATREAMASVRRYPLSRIFGAAAGGGPILRDLWNRPKGLLAHGAELLTAPTPDETPSAPVRSGAALRRIARAACGRSLAEPSPDVRAAEPAARLGARPRRAAPRVRSLACGE